MKHCGLLYLAGAVAATAMAFSPAAVADELFPPGTEQIGDRTYIANLYEQPFYRYSEWYAPYQVLDGNDESLGEFTNTSVYYVAPYQPWGIWTVFNSDVISDSSYPELSDGATQQSLSFWTITFPYLQTLLFDANYYDNPGFATSFDVSFYGGPGLVLFDAAYYDSPEIGTSLDVSFFGGPSIPIWDITYDAAGGAATGSAGLGDLFGGDLGSLGDLFDLDGLLGLDPGSVTDVLGLDPAGLADLAGLL